MPCLIARKEFTFLVFHVWQQHGKLVNENLIPVNTENTTLTKESVFLLRRTGKHFPFLSLHTLFSHAQITVSLFVNNWDATTIASFPFFLTHILQNRQNQTNHKSKQNPYPEDYYESIKAKWPNFPSKKHSLPSFPVPG
jgi:hypothetical protein